MATHTRERVSRARQRIEKFTRRAGVGGRSTDVRSIAKEALDALGSEWHRFDDIKWPGRSFADVDHVLVGPAGVFVVDSRPWSADISLERAPKGSGQSSVIDGLEMAAHAVGSLLGMTRKRPTPVLCFVGPMPISTQVDAVLVSSTANIVVALQGLERTLDNAQVRELAGQVRERLIPATGLGSIPSQRGE